MYVTADGSDAYAVAYFDFAAGTIGSNSSLLLQVMAPGIASGLGGTLESTVDSVVGTYPAKDLLVERSGQTVSLRLWFVSDRLYMLMVMGPDGDPVFPQHFMATFALK
jgi:hypothetical protein